PRQIKVPSFVDDSISAIKTMDMSVEGIFRKNGNIRRLKDLSDVIEKFLRELPEPLLTFKLHKLFITSQ
ncbi:15123_t:CDS:2, partial [Entrophospora sp. SA101]